MSRRPKPIAPIEPREEEARPPYLVRVGERVREARSSKGWSRRQLAEVSGVSERYLADLERGTGNASLTILQRVAEAVGLSVADLVATPTGPNGGDLDHLLARLARLSPSDLAVVHQWVAQRMGALPPGSRPNRLALIGLRGAGKTTLGEVAAHMLGWPFIELDREIEATSGMDLAEIFALGGQATFRRHELQALERVLAAHPTAVIATGGSLVTEPQTYARLKAAAMVVWIKAAPAEHMRRVIAQGDLRPMADNPQAMADLEAILDARRALYATAHVTFDTTGLARDEAVARWRAALPGWVGAAASLA